ncbi:hypothetical protein VPH35_132484 [Triticum aestivum]
MGPPHLSLSLSLPKTNQSSSHCRLAIPSSRWLPRQFPVSMVLPATAIPLPWIWLWRGLGTVRRCLMRRPHWEVWSLLTTTTSLMDGWMDDVCMLLCDEEMEFLPGAMMMTVAEISMS